MGKKNNQQRPDRASLFFLFFIFIGTKIGVFFFRDFTPFFFFFLMYWRKNWFIYNRCRYIFQDLVFFLLHLLAQKLVYFQSTMVWFYFSYLVFFFSLIGAKIGLFSNAFLGSSINRPTLLIWIYEISQFILGEKFCLNNLVNPQMR